MTIILVITACFIKINDKDDNRNEEVDEIMKTCNWTGRGTMGKKDEGSFSRVS